MRPTVAGAGRAPAAVGSSGGRGVAPALILGILIGCASPLHAQFSVQPVILEVEGRDSARTEAFQIHNQGPAPLQLRFYAADFEQDEAGDHRFFEPGRHERSCAPRLSVFPSSATLLPDERQSVRVRLEPGPQLCWSVVFVESEALPVGNLHIGQRIGVKVYGISTIGTPEGEIRAVTVAQAGAGLKATIEFRSYSDLPLRPEGSLEVRTPAGETVASVAIEPFSVLPNRVRRVELPLPVTLRAGRYLAVPVLDFGGDYLAGGQALFMVH